MHGVDDHDIVAGAVGRPKDLREGEALPGMVVVDHVTAGLLELA